MRCSSVVVLALLAQPAWADEQRGPASSEKPSDPGLELDPVLPSRLFGLGAIEDDRRTDLVLGPQTRLVLEGGWWWNEDDDPRHPAVDAPGRGWSATGRLWHDLGFFRLRLGVYASVHQIDARLGRGRHLDVGLSLSRSIRLSRWRTAWISLGIGSRRWLSEAPVGEIDGTQVMLTIGTTFR